MWTISLFKGSPSIPGANLILFTKFLGATSIPKNNLLAGILVNLKTTKGHLEVNYSCIKGLCFLVLCEQSNLLNLISSLWYRLWKYTASVRGLTRSVKIHTFQPSCFYPKNDFPTLRPRICCIKDNTGIDKLWFFGVLQIKSQDWKC